MLENVTEKLSAIHDSESRKKVRKTQKNAESDIEKEESVPDDEKSTLRNDLSERNGIDCCPVDLPPGFVLVSIIKDGSNHRRIFSERQIKMETKAAGGFLPIIYSPDGKSAVIDFDKDKGRYYVKAFLANVNNLREIRLLKWVIWMKVGSIFLSVVFFAFLFYAVSQIPKKIEKTVFQQVSTQVESIRKSAVEQSRVFDAPDPTSVVEADAATLEDSNPGRLIRK